MVVGREEGTKVYLMVLSHSTVTLAAWSCVELSVMQVLLLDYKSYIVFLLVCV